MLVIDADILIRAVLGRRVRTLRSPKREKHLPKILTKRGAPVPPALALLDSLGEVIHVVELETYSAFEDMARQRLLGRDEGTKPDKRQRQNPSPSAAALLRLRQP